MTKEYGLKILQKIVNNENGINIFYHFNSGFTLLACWILPKIWSGHDKTYLQMKTHTHTMILSFLFVP